MCATLLRVRPTVRQDGRRGALVVRPQAVTPYNRRREGHPLPASAVAQTLPSETQDSASLRSVHFPSEAP